MSPMSAYNKRSGGHPAVQLRQDVPVTATVYLNAPTGGTSASNSGSDKLPIAAIAGGLAAGVAMVVAAVLIWRCCGRIGRRSAKDDRERRGRRPAENSFKRISWRPEDSFSASSSTQKKGALPLSGSVSAAPLKSSQYPPRGAVVNVELRTSNVSSSDGSSRESREDKHQYHKSDEGGYVGPADLGYSSISVPYDGPQTPSPPASPTEKESPRSTHKTRLPEPTPPTPLSPTERARPWAPARPSPLAQASLRASAASPAPSSHIPSQYAPTPFSPPPATSADPFLDPTHPPQHFAYAEPEHYDEHEHDPESGGVGYAI